MHIQNTTTHRPTLSAAFTRSTRSRHDNAGTLPLAELRRIVAEMVD